MEQKIIAQIQGGNSQITAGQQISVDFLYQTDPINSKTNGVGFSINFNDRELKFDGVDTTTYFSAPVVFPTASNVAAVSDGGTNIDAGQPNSDETNSLFFVSWGDSSSNFAATSQPVKLFTAKFTVQSAFNGTSINLTQVTTDPNFTFASQALALTTVTPPTNNPPTVANPIADTSLVAGSGLNFTFAANAFQDIDAGDSLTYTATLENGNALPSWLTFNAATRTFSGTPAKTDVGSINVAVKATDTQSASVTDVFALNVTDNVAPTITNSAALTVVENAANNSTVGTVTVNNPETSDTLTYSIVSGNPDANSNGQTVFAINPTTGTITINDGTELDFESSTKTYTLGVQVSDGVNTPAATGNITVNVQNLDFFNVETNNQGVFKIDDINEFGNLVQAEIFGKTNQVSEIGVFIVDNENGSINGVAPTSANYRQQALSRAIPLSTILSNPPQGYLVAPNNKYVADISALSTIAQQKFGIYFVENGTSEDALNNSNIKTSLSTVSELNVQKVGSGNLDITPTGQNIIELDIVPITSPSNPTITIVDNSDTELLAISEDSTITATVYREADFLGVVGFYRTNGGIILDSVTGQAISNLTPGTVGYVQAAVQNRVTDFDLNVADNGTQTFSKTFAGGTGVNYAPFIIVDETPNSTATPASLIQRVLDSDTTNDPQVYLTFSGGNSDNQSDHIKKLAFDTFGFEDLRSLGDADFNDIIVQIRSESNVN
jgi:hypothetical protein